MEVCIVKLPDIRAGERLLARLRRYQQLGANIEELMGTPLSDLEEMSRSVDPLLRFGWESMGVIVSDTWVYRQQRFEVLIVPTKPDDTIEKLRREGKRLRQLRRAGKLPRLKTFQELTKEVEAKKTTHTAHRPALRADT